MIRQKLLTFLLLLIIGYGSLMPVFSRYMAQRPVVEKLGFTAQPAVLKFLGADQRLLVGEALVMQVLFYFGSLVEHSFNKIEIPTDYPQIYRTLSTALQLDPYNMDAYYFAQAILAWDGGHIKQVNQLLENGMHYRTWDFYLPFFAGFNSAYFLKDYPSAARYYKRAAELTGDELFTKLASRYMYEAGQTDFAIAYLSAMVKGARDPAMRTSFELRLRAFQEVRRIEVAVSSYRAAGKKGPVTIEELLQDGFLKGKPIDPYGGVFYLDEQSVVRTTSKFAPPVPATPSQGQP